MKKYYLIFLKLVLSNLFFKNQYKKNVLKY